MIPRLMNNEQSKLYATVVISSRTTALAEAEKSIALIRLGLKEKPHGRKNAR